MTNNGRVIQLSTFLNHSNRMLFVLILDTPVLSFNTASQASNAVTSRCVLESPHQRRDENKQTSSTMKLWML